MPTISLCMIVKNEEDSLARCLQSVQDIADEIIIVDTGSTDATKEVARRFTKQVYNFTWIDDFAAARNASFAFATMDYIMWLDADDILLPEDRTRLLALKRTLAPSVDTVMMLYHVRFDEQGRPVFSYYRERLVKRTCGFRWTEPVHEYLRTGGNVRTVDIAVTHTKLHRAPSGRNLAIYEARKAKNEPFTARGLYYYARELKDNGRTADAAKVFHDFLESHQGWVEDNIGACLALADCRRALGQPEGQIEALLRSFTYDAPRAEACCDLGYYYKNKNDFRRAYAWFRIAAVMEPPAQNWGFSQPDCWGYLPRLELAVCCDKLGRPQEGERWNEEAAAYKPDAFAVQYNRTYFQSLREKQPPEKRKAKAGETP